jgi:hypothetical protein
MVAEDIDGIPQPLQTNNGTLPKSDHVEFLTSTL